MVKKWIKYTIVVILYIVITILIIGYLNKEIDRRSHLIVHAADTKIDFSDPSSYTKEDLPEYLIYKQGDSRWSSTRLGNSTETAGKVGCFATTTVCILNMAGKSDVKPLDYYKNARNFTGASQLANCYSNYATGIAYDTTKGGNYGVAVSNDTQAKSEILKAYEEGYFIVIHTKAITGSGGHYYPVIAIQNNQIYVNDVGQTSALIETYEAVLARQVAKNRRVTNIIYVKSDNSSLKDLAQGYTAGTDVTQDVQDAIVNSEKDNGSSLSELLRGIYSPNNLQGLSVESRKEGLSLADRQRISELSDKLDLDTNYIYKARVLTMLGGILILIYTIFLLLAYLFDSVNSFFDMSLLKILTLGRLEIAPDDENIERGNKTYITKGGIIGVVITGVLASTVILTGKLFSLIAFVLNFFV